MNGQSDTNHTPPRTLSFRQRNGMRNISAENSSFMAQPLISLSCASSSFHLFLILNGRDAPGLFPGDQIIPRRIDPPFNQSPPPPQTTPGIHRENLVPYFSGVLHSSDVFYFLLKSYSAISFQEDHRSWSFYWMAFTC
ncbi:hypothetical protein CDAR_264191 [Caerostris darwini]|uniref:Uncharacterized protein n=1 Tax=Caerostris darwini TaxID=1538125 RepID=A0AAV4X431_9ARAC|nr:hypothetical protein CDAR_264191 [Caerostris darwini]